MNVATSTQSPSYIFTDMKFQPVWTLLRSLELSESTPHLSLMLLAHIWNHPYHHFSFQEVPKFAFVLGQSTERVSDFLPMILHAIDKLDSYDSKTGNDNWSWETLDPVQKSSQLGQNIM